MLPSETDSKVPKSVLRRLWGAHVLKAGLGVRTQEEVIVWFEKHPEVVKQFDTLNEEYLNFEKYIQQRAIDGLKQICIQENELVGFSANTYKRLRKE